MRRIISFLLFISFMTASCKKNSHYAVNDEPQAAQSAVMLKGEQSNKIASINICAQVWMQKNLNVTTYRNGDPIPQVTNPALWISLTTGAWCYYNNDPSTGSVYGKLYNGYAVHDRRGLAPAGWHIPSDAEWTTLTDCLGGVIPAGGKLKEQGFKHWNAPNTNATNSSRFTALPAGHLVAIDQRFVNIGQVANFWSSTLYPFSTTSSHHRMLSYNFGNVMSFGGAPHFDGLSVRCVKD